MFQRQARTAALISLSLLTSSQAFAATTYFDFTSLFQRYGIKTTTSSTAVPTTTTVRATTTTAAATTTTRASTTTTAAATTTTQAAAGLPAAQTCGLPNFQQELLNRINQLRAAGRTCGTLTYAPAPALAWNTKLFNASAAHSADMANYNYFSHTGRDGSSFSQRITAAGYNWSAAAENIAAGQTSVEQVMKAWADSPGHCANMMNKNYTEIGVACVRNDNSKYRTYWTMELARPR